MSYSPGLHAIRGKGTSGSVGTGKPSHEPHRLFDWKGKIKKIPGVNDLPHEPDSSGHKGKTTLFFPTKTF